MVPVSLSCVQWAGAQTVSWLQWKHFFEAKHQKCGLSQKYVMNFENVHVMYCFLIFFSFFFFFNFRIWAQMYKQFVHTNNMHTPFTAHKLVFRKRECDENVCTTYIVQTIFLEIRREMYLWSKTLFVQGFFCASFTDCDISTSTKLSVKCHSSGIY